MRRLWRQVAQTGGASLVSAAASLLALVVTARALGPEGRGAYVAATSWTALFATLSSLSLGQVVVHHVAGRPREEWAGEVAGTAFALSLGAGVLGWLLCAAVYVASDGRVFGAVSAPVLATALLALPLLVWGDTARYLLGALDALHLANRAQVAGAVAIVLGLAAVVGVGGAGVRAAVAITAVGNALVGALVAVAVVRRAPALRMAGGTARLLLRGSARLHFTAVGNFLYAQATVLVLNYYRPGAETGYYQLAMQLFTAALLLPNAIGTVAFALVAREGADGAWPEHRRLLLQATGGALAVAAVGYLLAPLAVRLLAGAAFLPAVPLFRLVLLALVGATMATVMASQWIGRGLFRLVSATTLAIGVASLATDFLLIPRYGMQGALASTLVTYGIAIVGNGSLAVWIERRARRQRGVAAAVGVAA